MQQSQAVHDLPFAARHLLPAVPAATVAPTAAAARRGYESTIAAVDIRL
ncbi:hypothetical protein [Streptomyces sp. NBC_00079]